MSPAISPLLLAWRAGFSPAPPAATPTFAPAPAAASPPTASPPTAAPPRAEPPPPASFPPPTAEAPLPPPVSPPPGFEPPPASLPPPPPPSMLPPDLARPRLYGDAGSMELSLALGYTQQSGLVGGGGFRRYILDGIAPGLEASVQRGSGLTTGLLLASVKLVPLRGESAALVLTGRAGRVFLSDHDDGWGVGGGAGVIVFVSAGIGLEVGYAILWLRPSRFCADLVSCRIEGPELGLRVMF